MGVTAIELLAIFIAVALVAALALGGSLNDLASVSFRHPWLVFIGLLVQSAALFFDGRLTDAAAFSLVLASMCLIASFLLLNIRIAGMGLAAAGLLLNVLVIAVNGAMPVHEASASAAGMPITEQEAGVKHEVMDRSTALPWLGDAIPLRPLRTVLSLGDVLLASGLALFVYRSARGSTGKRASREASDSAPATEP